MLGTRLLDHRDQFNRDTWPFFGWRSFAFTDQLDVVNRLYRDLLDAEGRYPDSGRVNLYPSPHWLNLERRKNPRAGVTCVGRTGAAPRKLGTHS